ncbi:uncharacterized protein LOC131030641 [Cryptomeria japonica]|uniref:uncharacterized protein LOC131030641 n=1 Tax=Cryptomeria japonica TaxID=3369 RepID=UPI0025ACE2A6|nr:uncharacterized protein LOC131030641 [Cryptomeria japonica]
MRYQTASPACMPASNGKKPKMICKKEETHENGRILNGGDFLEGKSVRLKGGSSAGHNGNTHKELECLNSPSDQVSEDGKSSQEIQVSKKRVFEGTGDLLLQWGQNKRSRGYRADYNRNVVDETSVKERKMIRIDRRSGRNEKPSASAQNPSAVHSRSTPLRPCTPVHDPSTSAFIHRNSEDPSPSGNCVNLGINGFSSDSRVFNRRADMHAPKSPDKIEKVVPGSLQMNCGLAVGMAGESTPSETEAFAHTEKVNLEMFEWPRIYISLSRKEKEDDFFAMKGSKLPQRPKKRAKNVEKLLQYCFPGNWLSDLTKARYEVREKKCVKKKPRGLKAMESLDSDSD